jgi:hypothetical protein
MEVKALCVETEMFGGFRQKIKDDWKAPRLTL